MLDALPSALPFTCTKCGGSGQFRTCGRCSQCKGQGGFRTSSEARAKAKDRAAARRILNARAENQSTPGLYLAVINRAGTNPFLQSLRDADVQGIAWTADQRATARAIIGGIE